MFRLLELELVHWDYWQRVRLSLDASIVAIVGPNGSGKTTLLDALRTLFALECSGKRSYQRYARKNDAGFAWLRATIDNRRSARGRHPFFPLLTDRVTLACRIEKKGGDWTRQYVLAEGAQSIEQLQGSATWIGVQELRRRLLDAGFTAAIGQVLSFEQGQTDKLCDKTPRELLALVFEIFGDQRVLDRYREARAHQQDSERDLAQIDVQLERLQLEIEKLKARADRLREWKRLKQERQALVAEIRPRVQYGQLLASAKMARPQLAGERTKWRRLRAESDELSRRLPAQRAAVVEAERAYVEAEERELAAQRALTKAEREQATIEERLRRRQLLLRRVEQPHEMDAAQAAAQTATLRREQARLEVERDALRSQCEDWNRELAELAAGRRVDPPDVAELRARLTAAGIDHCLLPEIVELTDGGWLDALEALLAPYRHLVLLERAADAGVAFTVGEAVRYRHFVVPDRVAAQTPALGSMLEVVRFSAPAPAWLLRMLNQTQRVESATAGAALPAAQDWVTRDGYLRERRGGRYAGVDPSRRAYGAGRRDALAGQLRDGLSRLDVIKRQLASLVERLNALNAVGAGIDAARELRASADEFAAAEADAARVAALLAAAQTEVDRTRGARVHASTLRYTAQQSLEQDERHQAEVERDLPVAANLTARLEQRRRLEQLRQLRGQLPPAWRSPSENALSLLGLESVAAVDRELARVEQRLAEPDWETDEQVPALLNLRRESHAAQQAEQDRHRAENARARAVTDEARAAYINVLRATVRRYARNLRELGELANVVVDVQLPALDNDDASLAQAGLDVRFNFDDKGFIGLNDGDASGGQQVIKSLILLIGLMMEEAGPSGFVFIDEPFAHLDVVNIDRVASFLKATRAQYLITAPVTHNVNVYDPAQLTLVTSKKRPGATWAPPVAQLVRSRDTAG